MPMGGVQDVQCAQLLPRVAQETHAARTHQGGIEFNSCVCTCISMYAVGVSEEFTFCCDCSTCGQSSKYGVKVYYQSIVSESR